MIYRVIVKQSYTELSFDFMGFVEAASLATSIKEHFTKTDPKEADLQISIRFLTEEEAEITKPKETITAEITADGEVVIQEEEQEEADHE